MATFDIWSLIPDEILYLILRFVPIFDHCRVALVCRAWRHASKCFPLPCQLPFLILNTPSSENSRYLNLVSVSDRSIYKLPLPYNSCGAACCGSYGNWLLMFDRYSRRSFFFNPFTLGQISFQDVDPIKLSISNLATLQFGWKFLCSDRSLLQARFSKVILSPWTTLDAWRIWALSNPMYEEIPMSEEVGAVVDVVFHEGRALVLTSKEKIMDYHMEIPTKPRVHKLDSLHFVSLNLRLCNFSGDQKVEKLRYLVKHNNKVLLVERFLTDCLYRGMTLGFRVYEYDSLNVKWIEIETLGDGLLFVGSFCSKSVSGANVPSDVEKNSIYFAHDYRRHICDWGVYSMIYGIVQRKSFPEVVAIHSFSNLDNPFRAPFVWFAPNMRKNDA